MKVLIIGAVAGGANTATRLRRLDEGAEIIIFERGAYISYASCGLPYFLGGEIKSAEKLALRSPASFRERYRADVRTHSNVTAIDRIGKSITVQNLRSGEIYSESYDKLVLATGAEPVTPPIPGLDSRRVFTLRTIPDALKIKAFIEESGAKSAIVVGGSGVGLEAAENLKRLGLEVTIVELADQLMSTLDPDMAELLRGHAVENGVKLMLGRAVRGVEEEAGGLAVSIDGGLIRGGLMIMSVGARPNSLLARQAELKLGVRGAIVVDRNMRTSDPDIFAVGDVVETYSFITGRPVNVQLAGPSTRQARVAAGNIAGLDGEYGGTLGTGIIKFFGLTAAFTGLTEREAAQNGFDCDKVVVTQKHHADYYPGAQEMRLKVVFDRSDGRLLGAQVVGGDGVDKRCDVLAMAIRMGAIADDLAATDLAYSPPYGSPRDIVNTAGQAIGNLMRKNAG